jgi:hypothetical protein
MKSLLGIVEMALLEDLIHDGGDILLLKGERMRHNSSNGSYVTIQMPLVKRTSITSIVKHIDYYKVNNFVIFKSLDLFFHGAIIICLNLLNVQGEPSNNGSLYTYLSLIGAT